MELLVAVVLFGVVKVLAAMEVALVAVVLVDGAVVLVAV